MNKLEYRIVQYGKHYFRVQEKQYCKILFLKIYFWRAVIFASTIDNARRYKKEYESGQEESSFYTRKKYGNGIIVE